MNRLKEVILLLNSALVRLPGFLCWERVQQHLWGTCRVKKVPGYPRHPSHDEGSCFLPCHREVGRLPKYHWEDVQHLFLAPYSRESTKLFPKHFCMSKYGWAHFRFPSFHSLCLCLWCAFGLVPWGSRPISCILLVGTGLASLGAAKPPMPLQAGEPGVQLVQ